LTRWTLAWWVAVIAVPLTSLLLLDSGAGLLFPLAGAIAAVTVSLVKKYRPRSTTKR
jgi:hypothetical protein